MSQFQQYCKIILDEKYKYKIQNLVDLFYKLYGISISEAKNCQFVIFSWCTQPKYLTQNRRSYQVCFIFGNSKNSHVAMSGEYGGRGNVTVLFLPRIHVHILQTISFNRQKLPSARLTLAAATGKVSNVYSRKFLVFHVCMYINKIKTTSKLNSQNLRNFNLRFSVIY